VGWLTINTKATPKADELACEIAFTEIVAGDGTADGAE
jgi:hypothetical protein